MLSISSNFLFLLAIVFLSVFAFSLQAKICVFILLVCRFVPISSKTVLFGLTGAAALALLATPYWQILLDIDNNIGVRALFWHNALRALAETGFIGVGYGTESIVPYYPSHGVMRYFGPKIPSEYSVIGVHSSFFQLLFNTGVIGLAIVGSWIVICIRRLGIDQKYLAPTDVLACGMLTVSIFTNMAFDSYNFVLGSAFLLGWIIYRGKPVGISEATFGHNPMRRPSLA